LYRFFQEPAVVVTGNNNRNQYAFLHSLIDARRNVSVSPARNRRILYEFGKIG
jgi:hypothetical protein